MIYTKDEQAKRPSSASPLAQRFSRRDFLRVATGALGTAMLGCARRGAREADTECPTGNAASTAGPYVATGPEGGVFRGPYMQRDARVVVYVLPADVQQLKCLCDTYLNLPGVDVPNRAKRQWEYVPLASCVLMVYADMCIASLDARDRNWGWMREHEIGLWVPVVARARAGDLWVVDHGAFFVPYLFVDNPYALSAGREVYGFPKMWGAIDPVTDQASPAFSLDVWGFETLSPDVEGYLQPLLDVRVAASESLQTQRFSRWADVRGAMWHFLLDQGLMAESLSASHEDVGDTELLTVPLVFLKQFPEVQDTRQACYQTVVEAEASVQTFYQGSVLAGTHQLTLNAMESHPIAQAFGLPVGAAGQLEALAAWEMHMDFVLAHGVEVW